ncbi:rab-like protein 2A [Eriocheir sinensis]|uniref:rab-like protein 2A n=1 Tax=Eriocheir sinensis TaxID=95602 RepID=UPI0021CA837F|nr:rab-like protein 2A [Eriocheir sinensis]
MKDKDEEKEKQTKEGDGGEKTAKGEGEGGNNKEEASTGGGGKEEALKDSEGESARLDYDKKTSRGELAVKVICLGDSAVGKSKLVERFLLDGYQHQQLSTFALTLHRYRTNVNGTDVLVDFWDTAGQERFQTMHPSYYHQAHAAILIFDGTRKITYKNLPAWYKELRDHRPEIPVFCAVNKIDENTDIAGKSFAFPERHKLPFYYVSASTGANVVRLFRDAISAALEYKKNPTDVTDQIMEELEMQE